MALPEIVWATHNVTGVLCPVPKEMFQVQDYLWTKAAAPCSIKPLKKEEPEDVKEDVADVHQSASGVPFKTEQAAKTAMKKKSLSEDEWMTTEVPDGFIITRK